MWSNKCNLGFNFNDKAEFSLQSSVSYDPSVISLICWILLKIFVLLMLKTLLLIIFVETMIHFQDESFDEWKIQKNSLMWHYKCLYSHIWSI